MTIEEKIVKTKDYLCKSNLPTGDYVINPYIGCPHGCKYCYASFMKRFTGHKEEWGEFIDIKWCDKPISGRKILHKSVLLSSVTDCYNPFEEKYRITRNILKQLVNIDCFVNICTKSKLVLRDIYLLKKFKNLKVAMSVNTLDEEFKNDMDNADSILDRLYALEKLNKAGIYTVLFMSPIFPEITDFKAIIEKTKTFVDEYWFENLNLRGNYKNKILSYINMKYPKLSSLYESIYLRNNKEYWMESELEIKRYCQKQNIKYINYFYHEKLIKKPSKNVW